MYKRKTIKEFPFFEVSTKGEIFSTARRWGSNGKKGVIYRDKKLSPCDNGKGYKQCFFLKDGKRKKHMRYIHRLVAQAFIPNPHNKKEVNHIDGNKSNNNITNLEWTTKQENADHSVANGLNFCKKVIRISPNGDRKLYNSHTEAKLDNDLNHTAITDTTKGRQKTAGGFEWENVI